VSSGRLGYYLIGLSVLANAASYHTMKASLQEGTPATVAAIGPLAGCAIMVALGAAWRTFGWSFGGYDQLTIPGVGRWLRRRLGVVALASAAGGCANVLMQVTISRFGPELAAFLGNLTLVCLVLGGLILGERVRRAEAAVMVLIFIGALMFSYQGGQLQWLAVGLMLLVSIGTATKQITIRQAARQANLPTVMAGMCLGMSATAVAIGLGTGTLATPTLHSFAWIMATAAIGGVVGMTLLYAGYGYIGVARGAPADAMRPLAVLMIGLALGANWPAAVQLAGAALVLIGSACLAKLHRPTPSAPAPIPAEPSQLNATAAGDASAEQPLPTSPVPACPSQAR
jgi:drug/metabolite transporter (DMT)-like permease